jgi:hypothetical protein
MKYHQNKPNNMLNQNHLTKQQIAIFSSFMTPIPKSVIVDSNCHLVRHRDIPSPHKHQNYQLKYMDDFRTCAVGIGRSFGGSLRQRELGFRHWPGEKTALMTGKVGKKKIANCRGAPRCLGGAVQA